MHTHFRTLRSVFLPILAGALLAWGADAIFSQSSVDAAQAPGVTVSQAQPVSAHAAR